MMPEIQAERQLTVTLLGTLGEHAKGTLGKEITDERADELCEAIPGFMVPAVEGRPETCMDDRPCVSLLNGEATTPRWRMGGGNLQTFYAAQRLIGGGHHLRAIRATHPGLSVQQEKQEYQDTVIIRGSNGKTKTGAHTSDYAKGDASGCAAADEEKASERTLVESGHSPEDFVAQTTTKLVGVRVPFDEELHTSTVVVEAGAYLASLERDKWVGSDLLEIVSKPRPYDDIDTAMGNAAVEVLGGEHDAELLVINSADEMFDKERFVHEFGGKILWIDECRIWAEAHEQAIDEAEAKQLYQTAMTANVAIAFTVGSRDLRIARVS